MQTQVMVQNSTGLPWLEYRSGQGFEVEQTVVPAFPFSIGRSAGVDLQIDSSRVSRTHAHIVQEGQGYRVRDLESTNGTVVNGMRVQDAALSDGDILGIADVEFVFHCGGSSGASSATQTMEDVSRTALHDRYDVQSLVDAVRRLHETTSRLYVAAELQAIVHLESGAIYGYECAAADPLSGAAASEAESIVFRTPCPVNQRLRALQQRVAIESVCQRSPQARIFLDIEPEELETVSFLKGLRHLCELVADPGQLVLTLPACVVGQSVGFATMYARMRDLGVQIAYDQVSDTQSLMRRLAATPGDYLKLVATLVRGIDHQEDRRSHFASVIRAGAEAGGSLIVSGIATAEEAATCIELGCRLGQGSYCQPTQPPPNTP